MWSQLIDGTGSGAARAMRELAALPWIGVALIGLALAAGLWLASRARRG